MGGAGRWWLVVGWSGMLFVTDIKRVCYMATSSFVNDCDFMGTNACCPTKMYVGGLCTHNPMKKDDQPK